MSTRATDIPLGRLAAAPFLWGLLAGAGCVHRAAPLTPAFDVASMVGKKVEEIAAIAGPLPAPTCLPGSGTCDVIWHRGSQSLQVTYRTTNHKPTRLALTLDDPWRAVSD